MADGQPSRPTKPVELDLSVLMVGSVSHYQMLPLTKHGMVVVMQEVLVVKSMVTQA